MSWITLRTKRGTSTYVVVVISPETTQIPVVIRTSQATRPVGSSFRTASSTESEIWSAILSGCPSVTDSDVKICRIRSATCLIPPGGWMVYRGETKSPQCNTRYTGFMNAVDERNGGLYVA